MVLFLLSINIFPVLQKKSIAVLPFKNWSGDSSYEYFCDGMTDEVISRLSKIKSFDKVTSRTSVFKYKENIGDRRIMLDIN